MKRHLSLQLNLIKIHRWALRHPRRVLWVTFIFLLLGAPFLTRVRKVYNIDELVTPQFKTYDGLQQVRNDFDVHNTLFLTVRPNGPWTEASLCRLKHAVHSTFDQTYETVGLISPFDLRGAKSSPEEIDYPPLLNLNCDSPSIQFFSLKPLKQSPWNKVIANYDDSSLSFEMSLRPPKGGRFPKRLDRSNRNSRKRSNRTCSMSISAGLARRNTNGPCSRGIRRSTPSISS